MAVLVANLGGEGEEPGAINVNAFITDMMINPQFHDLLPSGGLVIRGSAHQTGLATSSIDSVVANDFPIQFDQFIIDGSGTRRSIGLLTAEVARILKPNGVLRFGCSSCDRVALARAFERAGLLDVAVRADGYVLARKALRGE